MSKKAIVIGLLAIFTLGLLFGVQQAYRMFVQNTHSISGETTYIYVHPNTSVEQLIDSIEKDHVIASPRTLLFHAQILGFKNVKTGKYKINATESNLSLIRRFRNGEQTPIKITFNNIRKKDQLAGRLGMQLMTDSASIINLLNDEQFLKQYDVTAETALCLFLPDTYEVFWNTSPENLVKRMHREYQNFWNKANVAKAKAMGLTPVEVATLASIVEEESNKSYEKPIIAGLYYNRLKRGIPLQACPTVRYAWDDFTITRVLHKHLAIDSPYNTYKYRGLPPAPIRTPSKEGLKAVLNYTKHNYLYMCAKETLNGEHYFASSLHQHNIYAAKYQRALNQRKIYH